MLYPEVVSLLLALVLAAPAPVAKWTPIFNGKNLDGWSAKIKGYEFGDNFANTFRVANGAIQVSYDGYDGKFNERFGHLFYKAPFESYSLRMEYRFTGEQIADGPGWAWRNSGVMIHCQDPKTMTKDQSFPVSSEVQFLGGAAEGERPTGNVCSPGTHIVMGGKLITQHVNNSKSLTYRGDQWVRAEVRVHPSGEVEHLINDQVVLTYSGIQYDPNDADAKPLIKGTDLMIKKGWIALQSESHPVEFRKIEILKHP